MIPNKEKGTRTFVYDTPQGFDGERLKFVLLGWRRFVGITVIKIALNPSDMESAKGFHDEVAISEDKQLSPGTISVCVDVSEKPPVTGNPPKMPMRPLEAEQYRQIRSRFSVDAVIADKANMRPQPSGS